MDNVFPGGGVIEKDYTGVYTKWRKFMAWMGLLFMIALTIGIVGGLIWANRFIDIGMNL